MKLILLISLGILLWFAISADAQLEHLTKPREWTVDKHKVSAFYLSSTEDTVKLRIDGSDEISEVSLDQLSPEDVEFVNQVQQSTQLPILQPERFVGRVVKVADGDSFVAVIDGQRREIRMHGIDAPDHGQPFNKHAGKALRRMIQGQLVHMEQLDTDKYGRMVCQVYRGEVNLNAKMIELGYAWHYQAFSDDPTLATLQRAAQEQQLGIWGTVNPIAPWEWRKLHPRDEKRR